MEELLFKYNQLNPKAKEILLTFLDFLFSDRNNRTGVPTPKEPSQHEKLKSLLLNMEPWEESNVQMVKEAHESFNQMELRKW